MEPKKEGLYLLLISVHGLIRGHDMELGRDADTGGQTKYVVELARALGEQPGVDRVDLLTRRISDPQVSDDYSQPTESLSDNVQIVRIACAEDAYLQKEEIWDCLDNFSDTTQAYINGQDRLPDIIHSHYADAGYVGTRLTHQLGIPLIHTGHSLGRSKRKRLLASGVKRSAIEKNYNMSRRINAEEETLGAARRVITSTHQEIDEQYGLYDYYQPEYMRVVPPGTDLTLFYPPQGEEWGSSVFTSLERFLKEPRKPIILAISRPDQRKNIITLLEVYGESDTLQQAANLVIVAGNRDDILDMDSGAQDVLMGLILAVDQYNLYGKVAYPKHHRADEVPVFYRLAALSHGVFINPALTEPFGLTLIEAAASGLPIVATEDGGPTDIIGNCQNGYLIDPLDKPDMTNALLKVLNNKQEWKQLAEKGINGVRRHYSWLAHAKKYLEVIQPVIDKSEAPARMCLKRRPMLYHNRSIFTDLDQNLLGDPKSRAKFSQMIRNNRSCVSFGIATGRRLDSALKILRKYKIPRPDVLIASLGTEIYYAPELTKDIAWAAHIGHLWNRAAVLRVLAEIEGIKLQPRAEQSTFKISYYYDADLAPEVEEIRQLLLQSDISVNVIIAFGQYLDIVPVRASKGFALRWFTEQWDIPLENVLTAGGSGADEDMMRGNTKSVVVANRHHEELSELTDIEHIYFAKKAFAAGILEGIEYYEFLRHCEVDSS
ncbi:MAG: HAD family hydrolase [Thiothrix sp.]|nr:MAG: HAD family hydrolase [Thiothrix sp.]